MAKLQFVEFKLHVRGQMRSLARFVLMPDGEVRVVILYPEAAHVVERIIKDGAIGDRLYTLEDGPLFLKYFVEAYQSRACFVTPIAEMEEEEALRGAPEGGAPS